MRGFTLGIKQLLARLGPPHRNDYRRSSCRGTSTGWELRMRWREKKREKERRQQKDCFLRLALLRLRHRAKPRSREMVSLIKRQLSEKAACWQILQPESDRSSSARAAQSFEFVMIGWKFCLRMLDLSTRMMKMMYSHSNSDESFCCSAACV